MKTQAVVDQFAVARRRDGVSMELVSSAPWFAVLEARLPRRFPSSFRSLYSRYRFPSFDCGGVRLFGNLGDESAEDLAVAIEADFELLQATLPAGLLQIGRPDTGAYDVVCFDSRGAENGREYPLVLLDHEPLLQFNRPVILKTIDESFLSFMLKNGAAA